MSTEEFWQMAHFQISYSIFLPDDHPISDLNFINHFLDLNLSFQYSS